MKSVLAFISLGFLSTALPNGLDLSKCGQGIGYQPGGASVIEARYSFNTELDIVLNSCTVQKQLNKSAKNWYYIRSFTHQNGTATLVYELNDFTNSMQPMTSTCTLVQKMSYSGVGDQMNEDVSQSCTTPVPAK